MYRGGVSRGRRLGPVLVEGVVALCGAPGSSPAPVGIRGCGAWAAERVCQVSICRDRKEEQADTSSGSRVSQIKANRTLGALCGHRVARRDPAPLCSSENA